MRSLSLNTLARILGIRVYCKDCKAWFDPENEKSKDRKRSCSHPVERQCYKSTIVVPSSGGRRKRKSHIYKSRDINTVTTEGFKFKERVKKAPKKEVIKKESRPTLLVDCLLMFLDYKHGVGVQEHLKKTLSAHSHREFKANIAKWKEATELNGEDFTKIRVDGVSQKNVSATIKHLSNWGNSVQKKCFGFYNAFYRFLNENGYNIQSPFRGIEVTDAVESEARALTFEEFSKIKNAMQNGDTKDKVKDKKRHYDWLVETMDFAALTGRRREEFMIAKFSDIQLVNGQLLGSYIKMLDSKYSKQNKHKIGFKPRYTKAPIFPELRDFLMKRGFEEHKNSDRYIIAGNETKLRFTLANDLTNSFGFYRDKVCLEGEIMLKGLRKKYITRMRNEFGDNANFFTGHKESRIDKKHYYDDKELFEKVVGFRLW